MMTTRKPLLFLWGALFIVCAAMGFLPESTGWVRILSRVLAVAFFLPPVILLWQAWQTGDRGTAALLRNLAALSLGLTLALLIANFLAVRSSEALGNVLHYVLTVVSTPMVCGGGWAMSLYFWAVILILAVKVSKKAA